MRSPPEPAEARVGTYFATSYPRRGSMLARLGFRASHADTVAFVRSLDLPLERGTILDHGCGDGELLWELLSGHPRPVDHVHVRLEELAPEARTLARELVGPLVASIDDGVAPSTATSPFDVLLAIGVLEYYDDWEARLGRLASRAASVLVVTMPLRQRLGHLARRAWLRGHGLSIKRTDPEHLRTLAESFADDVVVEVRKPTVYCAMRWSAPDSPSSMS